MLYGTEYVRLQQMMDIFYYELKIYYYFLLLTKNFERSHKNYILNEQTKLKSHVLCEHIPPHTHNIDLSNDSADAKNKTNSTPSVSPVSYTHLDVYKRQV